MTCSGDGLFTMDLGALGALDCSSSLEAFSCSFAGTVSTASATGDVRTSITSGAMCDSTGAFTAAKI